MILAWLAAGCEPTAPLPTVDSVEVVPGAQCDRPADRDQLGPMVPFEVPAPWESAGSPWRNAGMVVADLTGDGWHDLFLPGELRHALFEGQGDGTFRDVSDRLPAQTEAPQGIAAGSADVDGDRALDLVVVASGWSQALWLNDGTGRFTPGPDLRLPQDLAGSGAAFGHFDDDPALDLLLSTHRDAHDPGPPELADPNYLLRSLGDGRFVDVSAQLGEEGRYGYTWITGWHDVDLDGDEDVVMVNDHGRVVPNRLLRNDGGTLVDVSSQTGMALAFSGMGLGAGDLNGDGLPDFLMSNIGGVVLLESAGGVWVDTGATRGFRGFDTTERKAGWGTELADLDDDGDLDALMTFGAFPFESGEDASQQPDAVLLQGDDGTFQDVSATWGMDHRGAGRAVVPVDLNGDGWLDVLVRDRDGPVVGYLARCGEATWLELDLDAGPYNPVGVGARVDVVSGGASRWRTVTAGGTGLASAGPFTLHFGLGDAVRAEEVRVTWHDGHVTTLTDVDLPAHVRVRRATEP